MLLEQLMILLPLFEHEASTDKLRLTSKLGQVIHIVLLEARVCDRSCLELQGGEVERTPVILVPVNGCS